MPIFRLAAPHSRCAHLVPEGAAQAWCGHRASHLVTGPVRLGDVCRRCWRSAPAEGRRIVEAATCALERAG